MNHNDTLQSSEIGQDLRNDDKNAQNVNHSTGVKAHEHVKTTGFDGVRWHAVDTVELDEDRDVCDTLVTRCGTRVSRYEALDVSPIGDSPTDLSGNTICYDCGRVEVSR